MVMAQLHVTGCWPQEVGRKNMNAQAYNDHVSFYGSHLALSPCGKLLLVSTEGPRLIVFRVKGARPEL